MIDSVLFVTEDPPDPRVIDALDEPEEVCRRDTGEYLLAKGRYKNLYVSARLDRLLVQGSVARYQHGSNFFPLYPDDASHVLNDLSDVFHAPFDEANVYRLDFGLNLVLDRPVSEVLSSLGYASGYMKDTFAGTRTGVQYRAGTTGKRRVISVYDKISEAEARKRTVPAEFKDKHVLRTEVQLKKHVKSQLKQAVKGKHLADPAFHGVMLKRWEQELDKIQLIRPANAEIPIGIRDYRKNRCLIGIETLGGVEEELKRLMEAKDEGRFEDRQDAYYRQRKAILDMAQSPANTQPNKAGDEFKEAVRKAKDEYRLHLN